MREEYARARRRVFGPGGVVEQARIIDPSDGAELMRQAAGQLRAMGTELTKALDAYQKAVLGSG